MQNSSWVLHFFCRYDSIPIRAKTRKTNTPEFLIQMYIHTDPLLELEKRHSRPGIFSSLGKTFKFLVMYFALSGVIFSTLLGVLNYSAYSSRIMNWVNPAALIAARDEVANILSSSSVEAHASDSFNVETKEDLQTVTEKILTSDPEIIYSRNYEPR